MDMKRKGIVIRQCASCGGEGTHHVTVIVQLAHATKDSRTKVSQFWLCDKCENNSRWFLSRDPQQGNRVAKAITPPKEYDDRLTVARL